jgi:hypothetical protein
MLTDDGYSKLSRTGPCRCEHAYIGAGPTRGMSGRLTSSEAEAHGRVRSNESSHLSAVRITGWTDASVRDVDIDDVV